MTNVVYLNDNDEIVASENATKIIIRECDEKGNLIRETFMVKDQNDPVADYKLTEDDRAFIKAFEENSKKIR